MLNVARFAFALRLGDGTDPVEPLLSALTDLLGACTAIVDARSDDACPDSVKRIATVQLGRWIWDRSLERGFSDAWERSGAAELIAGWRHISTVEEN